MLCKEDTYMHKHTHSYRHTCALGLHTLMHKHTQMVDTQSGMCVLAKTWKRAQMDTVRHVCIGKNVKRRIFGCACVLQSKHVRSRASPYDIFTNILVTYVCVYLHTSALTGMPEFENASEAALYATQTPHPGASITAPLSQCSNGMHNQLPAGSMCSARR